MDENLQGWKAIERPAGLFRRYDFERYAQTRLFLELLAKESERVGRFPDLSFGPRHVNVTIGADGPADPVARELAQSSDAMVDRARLESMAGQEAAA